MLDQKPSAISPGLPTGRLERRSTASHNLFWVHNTELRASDCVRKQCFSSRTTLNNLDNSRQTSASLFLLWEKWSAHYKRYFRKKVTKRQKDWLYKSIKTWSKVAAEHWTWKRCCMIQLCRIQLAWIVQSPSTTLSNVFDLIMLK